MAKGLSLDPEHVHQKKAKIITHLPNGKAIPKEMQKLMTKPALMIEDKNVHDELIYVMSVKDDNEGAMLVEREFELYVITAKNAITLLYDNQNNEIWYPKDCNPLELTAAYYE